MSKKIEVSTTVEATIEKAWDIWNDPKDIMKWCSGHPDWHTTKSTNDVRVGGKISTRMEAKDGSAGFDWTNTYITVEEHSLMKYELEDGRQCEITFEALDDKVRVTQIFDAEQENSEEGQKQGWQNIMDNFKMYIDSLT